MDEGILKLERVSRSFGGVQALSDVSLQVKRGSLTALIGPNGAGKTTLFNVVTGFAPCDRGRIQLAEVDITASKPHEIARRGIARTFQTTKTLRRLSVLENVILAMPGSPAERIWPVFVQPRSVQRWETTARKKAESLLARFGLGALSDEYAGALSGGQRKLLELARALMLEPELLMLDEPVAGVNPVLGKTLMRHISSLNDGGLTVLFIEHNIPFVREFAEEVFVLADGQMLASGACRQVLEQDIVIDAYLGRR